MGHGLRNCGCGRGTSGDLDGPCWLDFFNNGDPTHVSYRSGGQSAPDLAACSLTLAAWMRWSLGGDLGSGHLPMLLELRGVPGNRKCTRTRWAFAWAEWLAL